MFTNIPFFRHVEILTTFVVGYTVGSILFNMLPTGAMSDDHHTRFHPLRLAENMILPTLVLSSPSVLK